MPRTVLAYFVQRVWAHKARFALGVVGIVVAVHFTTLVPRVIQDLLNTLVPSAAVPEVPVKPIVADANDPQAILVEGVVVILLASLAAAVGTFWMRFMIVGTSRRIEYDLRNNFYQHLQTLSFQTYSRLRTGDLMSRATADIEGVRMLFGPAILHGMFTLVLAPTTLAYMFGISTRLTLLCLIPLVGVAVLVRIIANKVYKYSVMTQDRLGKISNQAQENFSGIKVVKAFVQEKHETEQFAVRADDYRQVNLKLAKVRATFNGLIWGLANVGVLVFVIASPDEVRNANLGPGGAVAFFAFQQLLIWPMVALGWVIALFQRGAASYKRLRDVFDIRPTQRDPEWGASGAGVLPVPPSTKDAETTARSTGGNGKLESTRDPHELDITGRIAFENVSFRYNPLPGPDVDAVPELAEAHREAARAGTDPVEAEREHALKAAGADDRRAPVLSGLSFTIEPGQTVAFIGPVGCGKTTLVRMIPRLIDPTAGRITIDGIDVRDLPLARLRRAIGYAPQDSVLFSDSIAANIAFSMDIENGVPREQIDWAARMSGLDADVDQFPNGFDQLIGERGVTLSGGQKQRTSLARAIMPDPAILVLDDSFSAVDTHTEERILRGLRELRRGRGPSTSTDTDGDGSGSGNGKVEHGADGKLDRPRTMILISHRVSTVKDADRIYVLRDGSIVEQGTDAELTAANGWYADLARKQALTAELEAL